MQDTKNNMKVFTSRKKNGKAWIEKAKVKLKENVYKKMMNKNRAELQILDGS